MDSSGNPSYSILGDGAVTYPAQQFAQENQTGIYRELYTNSSSQSVTSWAVTKRGNKRLRVTDTGGDLYGDWNLGGGTSSEISLSDGSASAPSLNFTSETDLGIYKSGSAALGFASSGGPIATLTPTSFNSNSFRAASGFATEPAYSFTGSTSTGIYSSSSGSVDVSSSGTKVFDFSTSGNTSTEPVYLPDGTASAPSLSFTSEPDLGLYKAGTGQLGVGVQGGSSAIFSSSGITLPSSGTPSITFSSPGATTSAIDGSTTGALNFYNAGTRSAAITSAGTQFYTPYVASESGPFEAPDGSQTAPSLSFITDPTLGFFHDGTNTIGVGIGGTTPIDLGYNLIVRNYAYAANLVATNGTLSSVTSSSITSTSITATNSTLGAATCSSLTSTGQVSLPDGSSTAPSVIFTTAPSTGMYKASNNSIGFGTTNTHAFIEILDSADSPFGYSAFECTVPILSASTSSFSAPAYSFGNATSSGMYSTGSTAVGLTVNGNDILDLTTSAVTSKVQITTGTNSLTTGAASCSSLTSTGAVTQPQYTASNYLYGSVQTITANTITQVLFPTATDTLTNWGTRSSTDGYVVPVAGLYEANANIYIPALTNLSNVYVFWTLNDASPNTTTSTWLGQDRSATPNFTADYCFPTTALIRCSAGDTLRVWLFLSTTIIIGSLTDRSKASSLQIDRLHS